jgi:hypothetical protein
MLSSKLCQVFFALSGYERAAFRKFVQSPYHNQRVDIVNFFEYLNQKANDASLDLNKDAVFAFVYPGENYEDKKMRYLLNFMLELLEDFFVVRAALAQKEKYNLQVVESYLQNELKQPLDYVLKKAEQQLEHQPLRNGFYWQMQYQLYWKKYSTQKIINRFNELNMQPLSEYLDINYISEKLKQACILNSHEAVYKIKYDMGLLADVLVYLEKNPKLTEIPAIQLYYSYYLITTQKNTQDADFKQFTNLLLAFTTKFQHDEMRDLYILAINYGIKRINSSLDFAYETLNLYKSGLDFGFLLENNKLSRFTFSNIIKIALHLKEYDWVKTFIETKETLLGAEYRAIYVHFAWSKYYFEKKDYEMAMQHLNQVEYEDIFLNLNSKVMQMKIYYELQEYSVLESFLASFRVFLNRKRKQLSYHFEIYKNIVRAVGQLMHVNVFSKKNITELKEKISSIKILTEREWLLKQIESLQK